MSSFNPALEILSQSWRLGIHIANYRNPIDFHLNKLCFGYDCPQIVKILLYQFLI
jgi:hypothetical protein